MRVNGKTLKVSENVTLLDYLVDSGYEISRIAVEMNGKIIRKKDYETVQLHNDDSIEIVTFMGGG